MPAPLDPWLSGSVALDVALAARAPAASIAARRARRLGGGVPRRAPPASTAAGRGGRLGELLAAARRHSPISRRLLEGRALDTLQLADLPVAHKAALMRDFDGWVTDPELRLDGLRGF